MPSLPRRLALIRESWDRFFYPDCDPLAFSLFRFCFYSLVLAASLFSPLRRPLPFEPLFARDVPLFTLLHIPPLPATEQPLLLHCWWLVLALGAIGFADRICGLLACLLALYLCGLRQGFGIAFHEESPLVLALFVMALAPRPRHFSVDGWLRRRWGRADQAAPPGDFFWPMQLLKLFLVYIFFSAALYKLYFGRLTWLTQNIILNSISDPSAPRGLPFILHGLNAHPALCRLLTLATLALEFFFPLVLFTKHLRWPLLLGAFSALVSIWAVFGYHFVLYMSPLFLAWLPWRNWAPKARPLLARSWKISHGDAGQRLS